MNVYLVHKLCRRILHDEPFRALVKSQPGVALASMPFTQQEREALIAGDVARLYREGAFAFLLLILCRFEIFGLDLPTFNQRMRACAPDLSE